MRGYLLFGALLSAVGSVASAQNLWTNPGTGDWHDADNWSLGVPLPQHRPMISNGGTAQISQDTVGPQLSSVFDGAVELVSADWEGVFQLTLGRTSAGPLPPVMTIPRLSISPGSTATFTVLEGSSEHLIDHHGGVLNVDVLRIVGAYQLSGGELNVAADSYLFTGSEMIVSGDTHASMGRFLLESSFLQTSGSFQATSSTVRQPDAHFRVEGGTAELGAVQMLQGGTIDVAGGEVTIGRLRNLPNTSDPSTSGNVRVSAGTLRLTNSIDPISTTPEFLAGDWTLDVPTGFATLHRASFVDVSAATLKTGPETLVTLPAGISPAHFASTEIEGIVHTSGSPLVIPAGRVLRGVGTIDDPLIVHGEISARNLAGGNHVVSFDASQGIQVHAGGVADLAGGRVTVKDNVSGVFGGELRLGTLIVGGLETTTEQYRFTQTGGLVGPSLLSPGSGSALAVTLPTGARYTIEQGTINLASASIGHAGGTGLFLQNDGDVTFGSIFLGAPGPGDGGRYELNGGTLRTTTTRVLNEFVQTGGLHIADSFSSAEVRLGEQDTTGVYDLRGGTHFVNGRLRAGAFANSIGTYRIQKEGILQARQMEILGPGHGILEVAGGTLTVDSLNVGSGSRGSHYMKVTDHRSKISIAETLVLGAMANYEAVPGTTIHIGRGRFWVQATDAQQLLGLNHTTLVFDGSGDLVGQVEVAGLDLGPTSAGYSGNFSLAGLVIGETFPTQVRLVDLSNNHALAEALYVRELWIGPGSDLDLNGLHLYYGKLHIDPTASVTLSGGHLQFQAVPEPATGIGFLGAIGFAAWRGRRTRGAVDPLG